MPPWTVAPIRMVDTRNTVVWEDALQQSGGFLDAWQNPEDPAVMEQACDNAAKIIRDAIAEEEW